MAHYCQDEVLLAEIEQAGVEAELKTPIWNCWPAVVLHGPRETGCHCAYGHQINWFTSDCGRWFLRVEYTFQGKLVSRVKYNLSGFHAKAERDGQARI